MIILQTSDTLTFSPGQTSKTIAITVLADTLDEANETVTMTLSNVSNATISDATGTFTITDDDATPSLSINDVSTSNESNTATNMTVTLSAAAGRDVTVDYATSNGTATAGADYTATNGTLTISAGNTTGTIPITVLQDAVYERDETVTMTLSSASNATISDATGTFTVTDDESAPTVTLATSATSIDENSGSTLTLTATLSGTTDADITVALDTSGSATEGTDYTDGSGNLDDIVISAGATTGTVTFDPNDDSVYEGDETATIAINGVTGKTGVTENSTPQSATITISENESSPTVTLTSSASSIAENAGSSLTLTATLSVATTADVTVALATSGTGTEGTDYTDGSGNIDDIVISAGDLTGTVSFTPTDDSVYEGNETGIVAISSVSGGSATEDGTQSVTITITENESSPTVTLTTSGTSIAENSGSTLTLTATISQVSDEDVTVNLGAAGTSANGTDYGSLSSITVSAGDLTGTATFNPTDDSIYEGNETAVVSISSVSGADAAESGSQSVTITITENESAPTVTLTTSATTIAENAGSSLTLTATLSVATSSDVTVGISTSGTGTEGTDYSTISDITISAGSTTGTVSFTPTNDSTYEGGNETGIVAIDTVSGGSATEDGTQSVTITITESVPTVTLSTSASSIAENSGSSLTLTATLSVATTADVTVGISTSGTGTEGTDYSTISDITISAGATTGTATFTPTDDSTYEGNETGIVAISSVSGGSATESGTQTVTITITENESAPQVSFSVSSGGAAENGGTVTLTATLSGVAYQDVSVAISQYGGTGVLNTDYSLSSSTITVSAGSTTGTITLTCIDDSLWSGDMTMSFEVASVSGGGASENGTQTQGVNCQDNESAPTVTLTTSATSIAENAGSSLTLTATLSVATIVDVTVALATSGTSTEGTDYTDGSGNINDIVISAGDTTGTVNFTPTDDSTYEGNETAIIDIDTIDATGSSANEDGTQQVTITITENESAPTVTLATSGTSIAENAGSSLTLTATLSAASISDTTISFATSGTGTEGTDYSTISDITISAGATTGTASFTPSDDSVYERDETAVIDIDTVSGLATENSTPQQVTITVTENESAPTVTLTTSATTIAENAGSSLTLTATLSGTTDAAITVALDTSGTATEGTDYTDGSGNIDNIVISAGATTGTVSFTPTDDSTYEGNEIATISINGVTGKTGVAENSTPQAVAITITENESAPQVSFSVSSGGAAENGGTVTLTATLSGVAYQDVSVAISQYGGTGVLNTDYSLSSSTITVSAGSTTGTITLTCIDDSLWSGDMTMSFEVASVSGGGASENGTQTQGVNCQDNESAPTVTLTTSATSIAENAGSSLTLTATLSVATIVDVTVALATSGTSTEGTDYTDGSGNINDIVISAGDTTGTVNFTPTDDSTYEGNETAIIDIDTIDATGSSANEDGTQQVTITITENESAPTVTLATSGTSIAENAGSSLTLTATLSAASISDTTISFATSGTGTEGTDYSTISDITISAGATTGTASFTPSDDSVYERDETAVIDIDTVSGLATENSTPQQVTITVTENESAPTVTLTTSATTIAENAGSSLTLTATLSGTTDAAITVALDTSGTATEGTDYTDGSGNIDNIVISAGATTGTVSFTPTDDSTYEGNEIATISINGVTGKTGVAENSTPQAVAITITENESAPQVSFSVSSGGAAENGGTVTLTATLSGVAYQDVSVAISQYGGTGVLNTDYSLSSSTITVSAGSTTGTITLTCIDDSLWSGDMTMSFEVASVSGGGASENGTQTQGVNCQDNESAPTVTLTTSATSIAENAGSSLTLTATLSVATIVDVTVALATSGTSTEGTDYTDGSGNINDIVISAGDTTGTVNFTPTDDSTYEGNETAIIDIDTIDATGSSANEDGTQQVTITIIADGDAPPSLSINDVSTTDEGNTATNMTVTLSAAIWIRCSSRLCNIKRNSNSRIRLYSNKWNVNN